MQMSIEDDQNFKPFFSRENTLLLKLSNCVLEVMHAAWLYSSRLHVLKPSILVSAPPVQPVYYRGQETLGGMTCPLFLPAGYKTSGPRLVGHTAYGYANKFGIYDVVVPSSMNVSLLTSRQRSEVASWCLTPQTDLKFDNQPIVWTRKMFHTVGAA